MSPILRFPFNEIINDVYMCCYAPDSVIFAVFPLTDLLCIQISMMMILFIHNIRWILQLRPAMQISSSGTSLFCDFVHENQSF